MKLKKFLSVFLAIVFVFGACTSVNAFASEERTVIDSGICGLQGDNLKWTLYDDGELVISGEGEMDWYVPNNGEKLAPWNDYYDKIKVITLEEGVTSIGTYAFYRMNRLHRINLPLSFEFYEDSLVQKLLDGSPTGAQVVICYSGNGEAWDKVEMKIVSLILDKETKEISHEVTGAETPEVTSSSPVKGNVFGDAKLYLNGEEPQIFCEVVGDENLSTIRSDSIVYLRAKYYFAGREDLKLRWNFEGIGGNFSYEENLVGVKATAILRNVDSGAGVAKLSVLSADGEVLATDTSETLETSKSVLEKTERDELTPLEKLFVPFVAVFSELFFAFGFGINILLALIAMPFYELAALLGID